MSSMTSQSSGRGRKTDRDHQSSRSKRDQSGGRDHGSQSLHSWTSPERRPDRSVEIPGAMARGSDADSAATSHRNSSLPHAHSHTLPHCPSPPSLPQPPGGGGRLEGVPPRELPGVWGGDATQTQDRPRGEVSSCHPHQTSLLLLTDCSCVESSSFLSVMLQDFVFISH